MTAKELLKPRFEVIENYPNSKFYIGDILTPIKKGSLRFDCDSNNLSEIVYSPEKYPHLFRKINWWEKRTVEQMPKKLVSLSRKDRPDFDISKEKVYVIKEWDMKMLFGYTEPERRSGCGLLSFNPEYGYIPVD